MGELIRGGRVIAQPLNIARLIKKLQLIRPETLIKLTDGEKSFMIEDIKLEDDCILEIAMIPLLEDDVFNVNHDPLKDVI